MHQTAAKDGEQDKTDQRNVCGKTSLNNTTLHNSLMAGREPGLGKSKGPSSSQNQMLNAVLRDY